MKRSVLVIFIAVIALSGGGVAGAHAYTNGVFSHVKLNEITAPKPLETASAAEAVNEFSKPGALPTLGNIREVEFVPPESGKTIRINLETMELSMYEDGALVETLPVISKGKPGSYWQTPGGEYRVLSKNENFYSQIGHVYMPYSMQIFGNYFLHGWPVYENGKPVPAGYSGGCIRLNTADAERVYRWADTKTHISILSDRESVPEKVVDAYYIQDPQAPLSITAQSYLVGDLESGDIILGKNTTEVRAIASITKLITALSSLDIINQEATTTISQFAVDTEDARGELEVGERIKNGDLMYPLLLESSNDAAEAIAEIKGRGLFIDTMNERAQAIGLQHSSFTDPSGIGDHNLSTAEDLFKLARYISKNKPYLWSVTEKDEVSKSGHSWNNIGKFYKFPGFVGGKMGYTVEAGPTELLVFEVNVSEFQKRKIVIVLLDTKHREKDVKNLLEYFQKQVFWGV